MAQASPTTVLAVIVIVLSALLFLGALTTVFVVTLGAWKDRPGRRRRRVEKPNASARPQAAA